MRVTVQKAAPSSASAGQRSPANRKRIGSFQESREAQAERVADALVQERPVEPIDGSSPETIQRKCESCEAEEGDVLRRSTTAPVSAGRIPQQAADAAAETVSNGGAPLTPEQRSYFEPRFGLDLSNVRLHTGNGPAEAAAAIQARAYTLGSNIAFSDSGADTSNESGRRLMAHELAHVVQQNALHTEATPTLRREESTEGMYFSGVVPSVLDCDIDDVVDDPATSCCTEDTLKQIPDLYATARTHAGRTIQRMDGEQRMDIALASHFGASGPANADKILANLRVIRNELDNPGNRHVHRCRADFAVRAQFRQPYTSKTRELYCQYGVVASANPDVAWMTFCISPRGEINGGWSSLLHEVVHVSKIGDLPDRAHATAEQMQRGEFETYAGERREGLYPNKGGFALRNADSYAEFIEEVGEESWTQDTRREVRQERRRQRRARRVERRSERQGE